MKIAVRFASLDARRTEISTEKPIKLAVPTEHFAPDEGGPA